MISPMAVATCRPTMNARYGDSGEDTFRSLAQLPPTRAGIRTLWPRLDIGKSSVTPWMNPTTVASANVRCDTWSPKSLLENLGDLRLGWGAGVAGLAGEAAGHDDDHGPVDVGFVVGGQPLVVPDGGPVARGP